MQITLFGAAGEVTGSAYLVTTMNAQVLVDCGMFQGSPGDDQRNQLPDDLHPADLDAVVLTHAHLDHSGRMPLLVRHGYRGAIYATPATIDVAALLLADAAHLQEGDAARTNRKRQRAGLQPITPLFDAADVAAVMALMHPLPYEETASIAPGVQVRLVEAGHILGSASVIVTITEGKQEHVAVFSGDLGPRGAPIVNDPARIDAAADIVLLESTYGDRDHRSLAATVAEFAQLITQATHNRGKILVPAFAVGRTQDVLYHLAALIRAGTIPPIPIYLDSPLAIAATELYLKYPALADAEARTVSQGKLWRGLEALHLCVSGDDSRALNGLEGPCIIIAGAGMCTGGRILHHLKHNLWRPETLVLIVGYQASGTLGRLLVEGARRVQIFNETIAVRAQIHTLGGFSAHAGQSELVDWLAPMAPAQPHVVLSHGEERARGALAQRIATRYGLTVELPLLNDVITVGGANG